MFKGRSKDTIDAYDLEIDGVIYNLYGCVAMAMKVSTMVDKCISMHILFSKKPA